MPFKDLSYLELWQPFCSAEPNHLCNFGREHQEEQLFEFGSVVQEEMSFKGFLLKDFLSGAMATLLFSGVEPFMQF